jgi:hypothetical protein
MHARVSRRATSRACSHAPGVTDRDSIEGMRALVAAFGVWGLALVAACFNPTFDNPACGPAGECPANHTCVQGVCRAMAAEIDAAADDAVGDDGNSDVDGSTVDAFDPDGALVDASFQCVPTMCAGVQLQCGNCIDDDADGLVDDRDQNCLGPCDDDEGRLTLGISTEANGCTQDCFFDPNAGQGDDNCRWDVRCYMGSSGNACPFNSTMLGGASCPNQQSAACTSYCLPLTPNGCDCFGCCIFPGASQAVLISSRPGGTGMVSCELNEVNDPTQCMPCQIQNSCFNPCDAANCEMCAGTNTIPGSCGGVQTCPTGHNRCGLVGQPSCPAGQACITGCCFPNP